MKNVNKKFLFIGILLILNIILFNQINSNLWVSIRSPLLTGLTIALAVTIPELNFNKLSSISKKKKLRKEDKKFNREIFAGLVGGLLVLWSQIAIKEIKILFPLLDSYIIEIFGTLIISILLFVIFTITIKLTSSKK